MANVETRQTYQEVMESKNIPVRYVSDELTNEVVKNFLINFMADPKKGTMNDVTPAGIEALANQKELKRKAIAAWTKLTGKAPLLDGLRMPPKLFIGPPGMGKTETYLAAAIILADLLDMELILDPGLDAHITRKSLVLSFIDCSGSNSSLDAGGIPYKAILESEDFNDKPKQTEVMNMMLKPSLAAIGAAGAGILIPDDIGNYAESVQQAFLAVALEQKLGERRMPNMACGFATNMGKDDKTSAKELSRAIIGRCSVSGVLTTPEDVYTYLKTKLPTTLIDATPMISALKRNMQDMDYKDSHGQHPAVIYLVPEAGDRGNFPAPRNITAAWKECRHAINSYSSLKDAMPEVRGILQANLGRSFGEKMAASMDIYARGAAPIAEKLINFGTWDAAGFKAGMGVKTVNGEDTSMRMTPETRCFLEDLASALVDSATNRALMVNPASATGACFGPKDTDTLQRFFSGLSELSCVPGFPAEEFATIAVTDFFSVLPRKLGVESEFCKNQDGTSRFGQLNRDTAHAIALICSKLDMSPEMFTSVKRIAVNDDKTADARVKKKIS